MDKTNELHTQERSVQRRAGRIVRALAGAGTSPAVALSVWLAAGLLGYLFTGADSFFSARPVGVAWLTALPGPAAVAGLFGSLLGCIPLGRTGIVYGSLFLLVSGVRMLVSVPGKGRRHLPDSPGLFREPSQIRAALACVVGFVSSGYQLIAIGLSTEALLFSLTMILGCTTLCLLFSAFFDGGVTLGELTGRGERPARTRTATFFWQIGGLSILFFFVRALSSYALFGLSLAGVAAGLFTLFVSRRYGALRGCAAGLLVTLGIGPTFSPAFALFGLFSGILWEVGAVYAVGLGVAAASVWCSYVGGLSGFLSTAPELTVAALIGLPLIPRVLSEGRALRAEEDDRIGREAVRRLTEEHGAALEDRIAELSDAFSSLSRVFHTLSDGSARPDRAEYLSACDAACSKYCSGCARRAECWEKGDRSAYEAVRVLSERLYTERPASVDDLPEGKIRECECLDAILSDIREAGAALLRSSRVGRLGGGIGLDYELVAKLLSEAAEADRAENREDVKLGLELRRRLLELGITSGSVAALGERRRWIVAGGVGWEGASASADGIRAAFEETVGVKLTKPAYEIKGGTVTLQMQTARRFKCETARAYRSADPGGSSGDTVGFFENGRDYFYALLSDGMGCGPTAALTSGVATLFLEKMLGAGNSKTTTLKLLNNLLRNCGEENAATVDLLEFDLLTGCATFIKSGAAPSYVKRGGSLFRIRSRTVPVGMMATLDAEKIRFDASPGDVIVMLSDGVSQTPEDAPWLIELLSENWEGDLRDVAQRIVAVASRTREHPDDLSVALIRILPAEDGEIPEDATPAETPAAVAADVPESVGEVAPSLSAVGAAATAMAATVEAAETLFGGRGERLLSEADADENEKAPEDEPPENGGEPSAGESEAPPDGDEENRVAVIPSVSTEPDGEKEAS
ncbi:MAG: SpoIIE family protein phosphatase [Clostridia bacterium]|nr:SpoIIE family protein phosphatase [Clostridia bacterium]